MGFTHIDEHGNALMVDVGAKDVTSRRAVAEGRIRMSRECFELVKAGRMKKGDVLGVAQVAGIMAAKKTAELIPLCHTLLLTSVKVELELLDEESSVLAVCSVKCDGKTGVEIFNLGTGTGTSVLEVVAAFSKACGKELPYVIRERRAGDIAANWCDASKAERMMGWKAQYDIADMCRDSWNWQSHNPNGFADAE